MKITIVTVCYNAEKTIKQTIESVVCQTYKDIEYLIIDGKSADATIDIVKKYLSYPFVKLASEKDNGLYDAMNKGIKQATGDYILFLNSGDYFCDCNVLEDISSYLTKDIVYGNVIRRKENGEIVEKYAGKYKPFWLLLQGKMMSHQVLFTKTSVMKKYGFDEKFSITADYNFLMKAYKDQCSMLYVDRNISTVENVEGISSLETNLNQMREEDDRSLRHYYPFWYWILKPIKFLKRKIC